jgi:hypothetical protein
MDGAMKFQKISLLSWSYFSYTEGTMVASFFVSLACLAVGLFWAGPHLETSSSLAAANTFYILLRVLIIGFFSFLCVWRYNRNTYHALSYTGLLIFMDQVGLKSIWFLTQFKTHPADWPTSGPDAVTPWVVLFNNAFAYIVFLPLVLLIAFLGSALGMYLKHRRSSTA